MNNIPVFLSFDNNYAPYAATTISSICSNTMSSIDFYLIDCGVSAESKHKIESMTNQFTNLSIEWIKLNIDEKFKDFITCCHFSKAMYGRILIPLLKPELKKAIYSDIDVVFLDDIAKLYNEDLEDYPLGAVWEDYMEVKGENAKHLDRLGLSCWHKYFCSGILLFDVQKWNQMEITKSVLSKEKELRNCLKFPDQDLLNSYFDCNYKMLAAKYNVTAPRARRFAKKGVLKNCVVRHFEGKRKPWLCNPLSIERTKSNKIGMRLFWKYAKNTPFYDELIARFPVYRFFKRFF